MFFFFRMQSWEDDLTPMQIKVLLNGLSGFFEKERAKLGGESDGKDRGGI